ncbi:hypothetical protein Y032_0015g2563 [Ancylostoma ceylanicum]|uniref:Uncharacterized protein n=1 Tax=Ancylostoma ceylanicum TaxID=53326 RepID=A0A016V961_9BILA|nr:hypothetical protein Y032_0015g2563 [Ancylostoma ceylanicum]
MSNYSKSLWNQKISKLVWRVRNLAALQSDQQISPNGCETHRKNRDETWRRRRSGCHETSQLLGNQIHKHNNNAKAWKLIPPAAREQNTAYLNS